LRRCRTRRTRRRARRAARSCSAAVRATSARTAARHQAARSSRFAVWGTGLKGGFEDPPFILYVAVSAIVLRLYAVCAHEEVRSDLVSLSARFVSSLRFARILHQPNCCARWV
jgi:hypothetical protein